MCAPTVARGGGGNSCDLLFEDADASITFCLYVRAATVEFVDGRRVWAEVRKNRQAAAVARSHHRPAEVFADLEQLRAGDALQVQKHMQTLKVVVHGKRAAYVLRGRMWFTPWEEARYSDAVRQLAEVCGPA